MNVHEFSIWTMLNHLSTTYKYNWNWSAVIRRKPLQKKYFHKEFQMFPQNHCFPGHCWWGGRQGQRYVCVHSHIFYWTSYTLSSVDPPRHCETRSITSPLSESRRYWLTVVWRRRACVPPQLCTVWPEPWSKGVQTHTHHGCMKALLKHTHTGAHTHMVSCGLPSNLVISHNTLKSKNTLSSGLSFLQLHHLLLELLIQWSALIWKGVFSFLDIDISPVTQLKPACPQASPPWASPLFCTPWVQNWWLH